MAKNKNEEKNTEKKEKQGGGFFATLVILLIILIIWAGIFALILKFDVGGLGERFRPMLEDIPVAKYVLPDLTDEEIAYLNQYPFKNLEEAMQYIKKLEKDADNYKEENDDYAQRLAEYQAELENLQHYEEEYENFLELREKFDRDIVFNDKAPKREEYMKWYESLYPENAARIYGELLPMKEQNETIKEIALTLSEDTISAKNAAGLLEEMTSNVDTVVNILLAMDRGRRAEILNVFEKDKKTLNSPFATRVVDAWNNMAENLGVEE